MIATVILLGILFFIVFLVLFITTSGIILFYIFDKRSLEKILKFEDLVSILLFHMEKSYDIIYKSKIMVYSLDALKMNEQQYQAVSEQFVLLTFKMVGGVIKKHLIDLYGDDKTLILNMMEYFSNRFEKDEIYKASYENLVNGDMDDVSKDYNNMSNSLGNILGKELKNISLIKNPGSFPKL
jgi:hypothetical protein